METGASAHLDPIIIIKENSLRCFFNHYSLLLLTCYFVLLLAFIKNACYNQIEIKRR